MSKHARSSRGSRLTRPGPGNGRYLLAATAYNRRSSPDANTRVDRYAAYTINERGRRPDAHRVTEESRPSKALGGSTRPPDSRRPGDAQLATTARHTRYTSRVARQKLEKTNAIRLLDQRRVPYEALAYDPAIHSAVEVAEALGVPPERVYKTLVVLHEAPGRKPLLVMIAGPHELDMR